MRSGPLFWCAGALSAAHASFVGDVFPDLSTAFDDEPETELPDLEDMRHDMHSDSYGRMANLTLEDLVKVLQTLGYNSPALNGEGKSVSVAAESHEGKNVQILAKAIGRSITVSQCSHHDGLSSDDRTALVSAWNWKHDRPARAYEVEEGAICLQMDAHLTKYDKSNIQVIQDCMTTFIDSHSDFLDKVDGHDAQRRLSALDDFADHRRSGKRILTGPLPDLSGLFERFQDDKEERLARLSTQDLEKVLKAVGYKQFKLSESKHHLKGEIMSHHTTADGQEMTVQATAYVWQKEGELEAIEESMALEVQGPAQSRRLHSKSKVVKVSMTVTSIDYSRLMHQDRIHKEMLNIFKEEIVRAAGSGISEENVEVGFSPGCIKVDGTIEVPKGVDPDVVEKSLWASNYKMRAAERVSNIVGIEKVTTGYREPDATSEEEEVQHGKTHIDMKLTSIDYFLLDKHSDLREKVRRIIQEEVARSVGRARGDVSVLLSAHHGGHNGVDVDSYFPGKLSEAEADRVEHSDLKMNVAVRIANTIGIETVTLGFIPPEEKPEPEVSDSVSMGTCAKAEHGHAEAASFANTWNQEHRYSTAFYVKRDGHTANCIKANVQLTKYNKANLQIVQMWLSGFERDMAAWHAGWMTLASARRLQFV